MAYTVSIFEICLHYIKKLAGYDNIVVVMIKAVTESLTSEFQHAEIKLLSHGKKTQELTTVKINIYITST